MALGLLGARGERHVHRRRSACDRAAFLWGLALAQAGAGEGTGLGRRRLWCGRRWRPEEEEMTVCKRFPSPTQQNSCNSQGKAPGGTLLAGCAGCWWRRRFGALFSYLPVSLHGVLM